MMPGASVLGICTEQQVQYRDQNTRAFRNKPQLHRISIARRVEREISMQKLLQTPGPCLVVSIIILSANDLCVA